MAATWLGIEVALVSGRGHDYWPRPGRLIAAARKHTFADLAEAIDDAFARWDRAHLWEFRLSGGRAVGIPDPEWDRNIPDAARTRLSMLELGEQFAYTFDFGDDWAHVCTVLPKRIDPLEVLGIVPERPLPYWGWGDLPDQYGRRWMEDDGDSPIPPDPGRSDLPPLFPWWGDSR